MTSAPTGITATETHAVPPRIDLRKFPPGTTFLRILGVEYVHLSLGDEGDLYLTHYGGPFWQHLMPDNWYAQPWMKEKRQRLQGTGTVYRLPTRPVEGHVRPSIDLCIKWSRVGQDVPLDTFTLYKNINAEFNSPFEEFALVEELRRGEYGPRNLRIRTQKPLGIFVPSERMQLWQTGRSRDKVMARIARRPGVEIDILRAYILIYGWIRGLDAVTAYSQCTPSLESSVSDVTAMVDADMREKGFVVIDHKPVHIITRSRDGQVRKRRDGKVAFAVVDYELLVRTADHENTVQRAARSDYLVRQKNRFRPPALWEFPEHLHPAKVLGVDYVYGRTESTGGALWVVGKDPDLFAYFLPERWRMKQVVLSETGQAYYVHTKDRIHLVWKVSRLGEIPPIAPGHEPAAALRRAHGYNAPFEKVALALEMAGKGVRTVYPRAIYMTGPGAGGVGAKAPEEALDDRRFATFAGMLAPDGRPVLPPDHDYITLFGYWRGLDDAEAVDDQLLWTPIDLAQAAAKGIVTPDKCADLVERHRQKLLHASFIDLDLKADHILLSYIPGGSIKMDDDGLEELRHCNFELVTRLQAR